MAVMQDRRTLFEELSLHHLDSMFRAALRDTGNVSDAEDLVQDTYLRAYRFFDSFRQGSNFKAWLLKILENIYINKYRKELRTPEMVSITDVEESNILQSSTTPETEFFDGILDDEIVDALNSIPEGFRSAVILAAEGLSYKEIAEELRCPKGTVMSRLHRGRQLLREQDDFRNYVKKEYGYGKQNKGLS